MNRPGTDPYEAGHLEMQVNKTEIALALKEFLEALNNSGGAWSKCLLLVEKCIDARIEITSRKTHRALLGCRVITIVAEIASTAREEAGDCVKVKNFTQVIDPFSKELISMVGCAESDDDGQQVYESKSLDVRNPLLRDLKMPPFLKLALVNEVLIKDVFATLLRQGDHHSAPSIKMLANSMITMYEAHAEHFENIPSECKDTIKVCYVMKTLADKTDEQPRFDYFTETDEHFKTGKKIAQAPLPLASILDDGTAFRSLLKNRTNGGSAK